MKTHPWGAAGSSTRTALYYWAYTVKLCKCLSASKHIYVFNKEMEISYEEKSSFNYNLITMYWCIKHGTQRETDSVWPLTHKSPFKSRHFNQKWHEISSLSQHFYMSRNNKSKLGSNLTIFHGLNTPTPHFPPFKSQLKYAKVQSFNFLIKM